MTTRLRHLLVMIALALPAMPARALDPDVASGAAGGAAAGIVGRVPGAFANGLPDDAVNQVRIEQRLIIRVTPRAPGRAELAPVAQPPPVRLRERKMANCVPVSGIAGVRPLSDSRIMLFMRDRRMVGADLAKTCSARDFYLGFYVSQTADGQLCVARDQIHSRAGTTCTIDRVRELIPDD